jgi:hypothetical protein
VDCPPTHEVWVVLPNGHEQVFAEAWSLHGAQTIARSAEHAPVAVRNGYKYIVRAARTAPHDVW